MMPADFRPRKLVSTTLLNSNSVWLEMEGAIDAQPGQFVMVWIPGLGEKPFSIALNSPFSLLVVDVGPFSHELHKLKPGAMLWIKGPLGNGFCIEGNNHLLVGGGYGAAPLFFLAKDCHARGNFIQVCLGAKTESSLLLVDRFKALGCDVLYATEDGSKGIKGFVTAGVGEVVDKLEFDTLYACGPTGLLNALAAFCHVAQQNYQLSWEAHMRCGMGLCGSCELSTDHDPFLPVGWLACYDGPVYIKRWGGN